MDFEDFNQLTDTGKHKAIKSETARADKAESKLNQLRRHAIGILDIALEYLPLDDVMARVIKEGERHKK